MSVWGLVGGPVADAITLSNNVTIREVGCSVARGGAENGIAPPITYIAYNKAAGSHVQVRIASCQQSPVTGVFGCSDLPSLATSSTANSFLPAVAVAHRGTQAPFDVQVRVSFWSDQGLTGGQIRLRSFNTANPGAITTSPAQTACPDTRGYMGDYDDMIVVNDRTASPGFRRPYTDSTDTTCNCQTYVANPQHVTVWSLGI